MAKAKLVTGLFKNRMAAEAAVDAIMKRGYTRDDISVMMSDATQSKEFALQARTHAADGAGVGGAVGGVVGAVLAAIVAVGSTIFLPGLNLVIAGPIAAALAGAGAGAATGGVIGPKSTKRAYARAAYCWALKPSRTRRSINWKSCSRRWEPSTYELSNHTRN